MVVINNEKVVSLNVDGVTAKGVALRQFIILNAWAILKWAHVFYSLKEDNHNESRIKPTILQGM